MFSFIPKEEDKIKKWKGDKMFNTETMLPISEVRWNTVVLKDWWIRWIVKVSGLNLDLKNFDEQQMIIEQYKKFLNWLSFPIQILVRNTYLDLSDYIDYMNVRLKNLDNDILREQGEKYVGFLDDINSKQWLIYIKEFYIIVSYYDMKWDNNRIKRSWWQKILDAFDMADTVEKIVWRYRTFLKNKKFLDTRCELIIGWLKSIGMWAERLELEDIVSLLFESYNPSQQKDQSEMS